MGGARRRVGLEELAELRDRLGVAPRRMEGDAEVHPPHRVGRINTHQLAIGCFGFVEPLRPQRLSALLREQSRVCHLKEKQE